MCTSHRNQVGKLRKKARKNYLPSLLVKQKGKCWWCDKKMDEPTIDHVHPLGQGGSNDRENCVASCRDCNLARSRVLPKDKKCRRCDNIIPACYKRRTCTACWYVDNTQWLIMNNWHEEDGMWVHYDLGVVVERHLALKMNRTITRTLKV